MSVFLFCLLLILWGLLLIQTQEFLVCLLVMAAVTGIFLLTNLKTKLPKTRLLPSKIILAISFWSCVAFCLDAYQKSINCLNCQTTHWKSFSAPQFTNNWSYQNMKNIWILYPRFLVIIGLFTLWTIVYFFIVKKENKK